MPIAANHFVGSGCVVCARSQLHLALDARLGRGVELGPLVGEATALADAPQTKRFVGGRKISRRVPIVTVRLFANVAARGAQLLQACSHLGQVCDAKFLFDFNVHDDHTGIEGAGREINRRRRLPATGC